ncbi:MAG: TatD family hydrolase [Gemmatimonadales bacterium]
MSSPLRSNPRRSMIEFIDSHAHLADAAFDADRDATIQRARAAGALGVVCVGESIAAAERAAQLAAAQSGFLFATAGVHPHDAADFDSARDSDAIRSLVARGAVAVGECGLDYHYDHSPREAQRRAFAAQLVLARECDRPVVVHTRDAESDSRAMIAEAGISGVVGVLHCYTGSMELAAAALDVGWYVSFSGIITFKRWEHDDVVRAVPSGRLLVESDSPYLAPVPHRGKRNEPAWVNLTVARLAVVRGADPEALGNETAANAVRLFGLAGQGRDANRSAGQSEPSGRTSA